MAHTRTADPLLRVPIAVYLRCHPYDRWRMEPHHHALLYYADRMSLSAPDVFFDNGCRSKGPLPQLDRLLRAVDSGCYQVLLVPGPFVLSLDDRKAQDLIRWIRSRGCRVEELPARSRPDSHCNGGGYPHGVDLRQLLHRIDTAVAAVDEAGARLLPR